MKTRPTPQLAQSSAARSGGGAFFAKSQMKTPRRDRGRDGAALEADDVAPVVSAIASPAGALDEVRTFAFVADAVAALASPRGAGSLHAAAATVTSGKIGPTLSR